jgi:hypothetical protein
MSAVRSGCLHAALLVAAIVSSSAVAEISPNAERPTGRAGRFVRKLLPA